MPLAFDPEPRSDILSAALDYLKKGWSVIPVAPGDKKPLIKWQEFQRRLPTEEEVHAWFTQWPQANIGIVTGAVSGLVVIDLDGPDGCGAIESLGLHTLQTPVVRTGKGQHYYLSHPGGVVPNSSGRMPGVDVRGDGGFVVAPPSIHASGIRYRFETENPAALELAEVPESAVPLLSASLSSASSNANVIEFRPDAEQGALVDKRNRYLKAAIESEVARVVLAHDGVRNVTLNGAAYNLGQLVGGGELSRDSIADELMRAATRCGLPRDEARRTIASGLAAGERTPRKAPGGPEENNADFWDGFDPSVHRLDSFTQGEPPERQWLVKDAIPLGVLGVLFGPGGVGKSFVVLELCIKVAARAKCSSDPRCFMGEIPASAAGPTVFITLEDDRDEIHRRIAKIDPENMRAGAPCYVICVLNVPGFEPAMVKMEGRAAVLTKFAREGLDALLSVIEQESGVPVRVIAMDPAGDLIEGNEDSAETVKLLMRRMREVCTRHGCTGLLLGHIAKGEHNEESVVLRGMRGSGAWIANARFAIALYNPPNPETLIQAVGWGVTQETKRRVVESQITKANFPMGRSIRKYMRDPTTGLLIDYTERFENAKELKRDEDIKSLVVSVTNFATEGRPTQATGGGGLKDRRKELPEPLNQAGEKYLVGLANEAVKRKLLVKCKENGKGAACWLDAPNGPYATWKPGQEPLPFRDDD